MPGEDGSHAPEDTGNPAMLTARRLTLLVIPEEGGRTYEIKLPRALVWVAGFLGVCLILLLAVGMRSHVAAGHLRDRVTRPERQKGELEEGMSHLQTLRATLRRLEQSNRQLRDIASGAVGLQVPRSKGRESLVQEQYISSVQRLIWGRTHTVPCLWPTRGAVSREFSAEFAGVAIAVPPQSLVRASAAGRVVKAAYEERLGFVVELDHGNRLISRYGYNMSLMVQPGDYVYMGQPIAFSGSSGTALRPSLYFAVSENGEPRDPRGYRLWL